MAEIDTSPSPEHLMRSQDRLGRMDDGQASTIQRLNPMPSRLAPAHANDAAQDATIAETDLRLSRIERRLDPREEA